MPAAAAPPAPPRAPAADAAASYLSVYPEGLRKKRRVRDLGRLITRFVDAADSEAVVDALAAWARYLREPDRRLPLPAGVAADAPAPQRRLLAFVTVLESPAAGAAVRARLAAFLRDSDGIKLFAEAGLPNDRGLIPETGDRLLRRLLPTPRDDHDLAAVLPRLLPDRAALAQFEALDLDVFARLAEAVGGGGDPSLTVWQPVMQALCDAIVLLGARIQGLGLAEGIRDRGRTGPIGESPFYRLPRAGDAFLAARDRLADRLAAERRFREAIEGCRIELRVVLERLEVAGVSLDVVYTLEVIDRALARLELLVAVVAAAPGEERARAVFALLLVLAKGRVSDGSLRALIYGNVHLLARKLVERAGQTGEHYIAAGRRDFFGLFARAAGGGFITALTAAGKLMIAAAGLPLFVAGLGASAVYSASFVLIQLCGFTLATKQPSMTAATLAATLGRGGREHVGEIVIQTTRIVRSQLVAAVGNVITVSAGAFALDWLIRQRTGAPLLDTYQAEAVLASLHPTRSGTAIYAAITGVILWAASLVGGWVENFAVCRRLPQAIAEHRARRWLGKRFLAWASRSFARNVSGVGVSLALGVFLGMAPPLGAFFGLPIDVRHVTLTTGQLAFAVAEGGAINLTRPEVGLALVGIAVTFVLNLGVSFSLALAVALRARDVPRRDRWALLRAIARHFLRHPLDFVRPPPQA